MDEIDEIEELGLTLGIPSILTLNPLRLQRILDFKEKEKIERFNEMMCYCWKIGQLVGIAVNSPKNYPKRPPVYKEHKRKEQTRDEYIKEWAAYVKEYIND